jgi:4-diphosphocytidyl-2C-methyl-D-erythritol kinase
MLVAVGAGAAAAVLARDSTCLFARMTGSGPAAFWIFPTRTAAESAAARLASAQQSWWVAATMTGAG